MTITALPVPPVAVEARPLPEFVGPTPSDIELAEAELIAAGLHFTVVDAHAPLDCSALAPHSLPTAA